jgi:hypothetical protein
MLAEKHRSNIATGMRVVRAMVASILLGILGLFNGLLNRFSPGARIAVRRVPTHGMDFAPVLVTAILINAACWFVVICGLYLLYLLGHTIWQKCGFGKRTKSPEA